jgi:hypothetical protein
VLEQIVYANSLWVAVGWAFGNAIQTSPDGSNWTGRTNPFFNGHGIAYNGSNLWVAVGHTENGPPPGLATSEDAFTWTENSNIPWGTAVTYANGLWVVGLNSGVNAIITSTDGSNWTYQSTSFATVKKIAYNGSNLWVAVGNAGSSNSNIQTSPDASNWTARPSPLTYGYTVEYNNGLWMAGGPTGGPSTNTLLLSQDGISWTSTYTETIGINISSSGAFNIANSIYVDTTNKVGINNANPRYTLDVDGTINTSSITSLRMTVGSLYYAYSLI